MTHHTSELENTEKTNSTELQNRNGPDDTAKSDADNISSRDNKSSEKNMQRKNFKGRNNRRRNQHKLGKGPYVVDTSVFMSGLELAGFKKLLTTPEIINEMKKGTLAMKVETLLAINLEIKSPGEEALKK
ncbi:MAG: hypothetical protein QW728_00855, partial [Thermoplasmata archaeon]